MILKIAKQYRTTNHLKRKLDPIPTIHSEEALKTPSCTYTPVPPRKKPKVRNMQEEQIHDFRKLDEIKKFEDLGEKHAPPGYSFKRGDDHIIYYKIEFDKDTSFPRIFVASKSISTSTCNFNVTAILSHCRCGLFRELMQS